MAYEIRTCASCGNREPMDLSTDVRFAGEFGPLCDDCLPLALRTMEANTKDNADPATDPALLALARLGALMCRDADWPRSPDDPDQSPGYIDLSACELRRVMDDAGLLLGRDGTPEPGVRAAIAALLAPDGAGEVAP